MPTQGGPAQPVVVSSGPIAGGPAIPVQAMTDATADRAIQGGPAIAVYDATAEVNAGTRAMQGGPAIPMAVRASGGGGAAGGPAIPVYVVSGSFSGGGVTHFKRGMKIGLAGAYTYAKDR